MNMINGCGVHMQSIGFLASSLLKLKVNDAFWNTFAEYLQF